jgi:hypothetical protein
MSDGASSDVPERIEEPVQLPQAAAVIQEEESEVKLSPYTNALLESLKQIKKRAVPDDMSKLSVSQTVSFLAIAYEKIRNAVEYREDHLVLRAAVERILKRRLALNPEGKGEAENLLRELTWARYFPNESLGEQDIEHVQKILDRYLVVKAKLIADKPQKEQVYLYQYLFELMTCEIEEVLSPEDTERMASYTYFAFQTLKDKIRVEGLDEEKKDAFFLASLNKSYRKSDLPYQRYYLFTTFYAPPSRISHEESEKIIHDMPSIFKKIDEMINNPNVGLLSRFTKKQLPPFLILFDILDRKIKDANTLLANKTSLWQEVEATCKEKYQQVGHRIRGLAIRSLIYIFITKMLLALVLEYPVSQYLYNEVHITSIIINTVFPPLLMLVILLFFKLPKEDNTKKIFERIVHLVDADRTFETQVSYLRKRIPNRKNIQVFIFTVIYSLTFLLTLYLIYRVLSLLDFNMVSQALFVFFISVVSFFSYRVKQVTNEYKLIEKEGILSPIVDFFFMPILSMGSFFSRELGRLNVFIVIFDFFIEAPFKLVIEIFEDWIKFVRARKEEIV